jgi:aclacinomycin oxidase
VLCRRHGLVVDHLEAVEVVVADRSGQARCVVATRDPSDPNHELWWAHTGAGGGNFGVVTRYWFRSPGVDSTDPARLLPAPPASVLRFAVDWRWAGMDERAFTRLVRNHGRWFEDHGAPDSPYAGMYSELYLQRQPLGWHYLIGQLPDGPDAQRLLDDFVAALGDGVGAPQRPVRVESRPWVSSAISGLSNERGVRRRAKIKSGYLRRSFTDRQIAALYRHLTRSDSTVVAGMVTVMAYGGAVNSVPPAATATAQRDSVMKLSYLTVWSDPAEDGEHLSWLRELYRDVYADTGGVPVPGDVSDGAYINYPDVDLADPRWNTSGVGWHTLYYKDNYTRLQQVKARWDPGDVFRHALSVRPA